MTHQIESSFPFSDSATRTVSFRVAKCSQISFRVKLWSHYELSTDIKTTQKSKNSDTDFVVVIDAAADDGADTQTSDSAGKNVLHCTLRIDTLFSSLKARRLRTPPQIMSLNQSENCHILSLGVSLPLVECPVFAGQTNYISRWLRESQIVLFGEGLD